MTDLKFGPDGQRILSYRHVKDLPSVINKLVATDIETDGLRPLENKFKSISFSRGTDGETLFSQEPLNKHAKALTNSALIAHRAQFEHAWFLKEGIDANILHDTCLLGYLIDENSSTGLEAMCVQYGIDVDYKPEDRTIVEGKELADYNCRDTHNTYELFKKLWPLLDERSKPVYHNVLMPATRNLALIELAGMHIDPDRIPGCESQITEEIEALDLHNDPSIKMLEEGMGKEFNIKSTPQRKILVYDILGYAPISMTKKGAPSTKSDVLEKLLRKRHTDTLEKMIRYSELRGMRDNFLNVMRENMRYIDGRWFVFTSLWLGDTSTGRLKSNSPNLQNTPKSFVRRIFTSRFPGGYLLEFDWAQVELRILSGLSMDELLIDDFNTDKDPHTETGKIITGKKDKSLTEKERDAGKRVNFMIPTGASAWLLAFETGMTPLDAQLMLRRYWRAHKGLKDYFDSLPESGTVWSPTGMKRTPIGDRAKNQIRNFPIQNSALILHLAAINKLNPIALEMGDHLVLPNHDAFLSDCQSDFKETYHIQKEILESVGFDWLPVPLKAEGKVGLDFGNMIKINDKFWEEYGK